jgi:integrase
VKARVYLRVDEFQRLVAAAGGHPRDHCILTLFLQARLRVSELVNLEVTDVDLTEWLLIVRNGKGGKDRAIPLEKRSYTALKTYLDYRKDSLCPELFLSYQGSGMSRRRGDWQRWREADRRRRARLKQNPAQYAHYRHRSGKPSSVTGWRTVQRYSSLCGSGERT